MVKKKTGIVISVAIVVIIILGMALLYGKGLKHKLSNTDTNTTSINPDDIKPNIGKPINSGYYFQDGKYINAPYMVSRRVVSIYINDIMLQKHQLAPNVNESISIEEMPKIPPGMNADSTFDDLIKEGEDGLALLSEVYRYSYAHYTPELAPNKIIAWCQALPFVVKVERNQINIDTMIITTNKGDKQTVFIGPDNAPKLSQEMFIKELDDFKGYYEDKLSKGWCILVFANGDQLFLREDITTHKMGTIVEILASSISDGEKNVKLRECLGFDFEDNIKAFNGFIIPPQLKERIKTTQAIPNH